MAGDELDSNSTDTTYSLKQGDITEAEANFDPTKTGFLDLPAELRNEIYGHALVTECHLLLVCAYVGPGEWKLFRIPPMKSRLRISGQLLAVCSQVYREANPILYGGNRFEMHCDDILCFQHLVARSLKHVRQLTIEGAVRQKQLKRGLRELPKFENLDKLVISSSCYFHFKKPKTAAAGFRPFLRSMLKSRVGTDKKKVSEVVEFDPSSDTVFYNEMMSMLEDVLA